MSQDTAMRLPTISRTDDLETGDLVWTLRIPQTLTTDLRTYEELRRRLAVWTLRLVAQALEELP